MPLHFSIASTTTKKYIVPRLRWSFVAPGFRRPYRTRQVVVVSDPPVNWRAIVGAPAGTGSHCGRTSRGTACELTFLLCLPPRMVRRFFRPFGAGPTSPGPEGRKKMPGTRSFRAFCERVGFPNAESLLSHPSPNTISELELARIHRTLFSLCDM